MDKKNKLSLDRFKNYEYKRKVWHWALIILSILAVLGINIGAKILTDKFSLRSDLTKNKVFSITDESIDYVSKLDKDIEIIVLNTEDKFLSNGDYYEQANSVINEYSKYSDKISVKYVNLDENPNIKSEYSDEETKENSIIIKCGDKHKILSAYDIFNIQQSYAGISIVSSKAEQVMTSTIMSVTSNESTKINMITGFDEMPAEDFVKLLESNNYEVTPLSMLTDDMNDTQVSIIYSPNRDYDSSAIEKIRNYLYNEGNYGRNVVYFVNPGQPSLPVLDGLAKEWGIGINDGLVFETDISKLFIKDRPFNTVCEYEESSPYSQAIKNRSIPVGMPISKPLEVLDDSKVSVMLRFSVRSGVMPSNTSDDWSPTEQDIKGNIPCMVISTNSNSETGAKSTFIVVGSAAAVDGSLLSRNSLNNSLYFLNLFSDLTNKNDTINIEPKSIGVHEITINPFQAVIIGIGFAVILPLLILVSGIVVWLVRRKR